MKFGDPEPFETIFLALEGKLSIPIERSKVFYIVVLDDGIAHTTRRDGLTCFSSEEYAQMFADELIESGETLIARVEAIDGYGIPYDPDPEIYADALRREAARRLRIADEETQARLEHKWRREDTLFNAQKVFALNAPSEFKRELILAHLGLLGLPERFKVAAMNIDSDVFLQQVAVALKVDLS